ncbi:MAG: GIY-YIG nuclease family protein [Comamonadaceae bacterium]|nr:MAG: GIY-YIG nuclease family protein [Comamonadaceae bacterium]
MNFSAETKRALARQYKERPCQAGVFAVRNNITGHVYLGAHLDVEAGLNRVRFELPQRSHRNAALQKDWNALGPSAFTFTIVDRVKVPADDAGFDVVGELAALLALWREELLSGERDRSVR